MSDQVELVSDREGLAVLGSEPAVARFLRQRALLTVSEDLRIGDVAQALSVVADGVANAAAQSGRWVKLTEESAGLVKEFGLMNTATPGVSHAMIGDAGAISRWIQIDTTVSALLSNPALLTEAASVMAQLARQREMRELRAYLARIEANVSELLRAQSDANLAKLWGARRSVERAWTVREGQGDRTDATTWSTVQGRVSDLDDLLSWAIIRLNRVAEKLQSSGRPGERAVRAEGGRSEVAELLAVIAHCFELQGALDVLRLDRVLAQSPSDADAQRIALEAQRQHRQKEVLEATERLVTGFDAAAASTNSHLLLHPKAAKAVTRAANAVGTAVVELRATLGIAEVRAEARDIRWVDAVRDSEQLRNAGREAGPRMVVPVLFLSGGTLFLLPATRPTAVKVFSKARSLLR